mmetsp:Transcript_2042/g.5891  ORF Transcript_2042/g.5891 Transcript_2042/m.5891 type:complete len:254 (+) Transcript_2042:851-1612(+)
MVWSIAAIGIFTGSPARVPLTVALLLERVDLPLTIAPILVPLTPLVDVTCIPLAAAVVALAVLLFAFRASRTFLHVKSGFLTRVPHTTLDSLTEVPPESKLGERLHDVSPASPDAIIAASCLHQDSAVEEAEELCPAALRSTVIGCSQLLSTEKLQELAAVEPLSEKPPDIAATKCCRSRERGDGPSHRWTGHLALTSSAADGAQSPTGFGKERLLWSFEHLLGRLPAHGTLEHLQYSALFLETLPKLISGLR